MSIDKLRQQHEEVRNLLDYAIANKDQQSITLYRGRLIRNLTKLLGTTTRSTGNLTPVEEAGYKTELDAEMVMHRNQINYRLRSEKRNRTEKYCISQEIGLKIRRTANSIRKIKHANNGSERVGAIVETAGNTLSTVFSATKFVLRPVGTVVQKVGGGTFYLAGCAVGGILDVGANLFGKVINPDREWSFTIAKKFGGALQTAVEATIGAVNDAVIRL